MTSKSPSFGWWRPIFPSQPQRVAFTARLPATARSLVPGALLLGIRRGTWSGAEWLVPSGSRRQGGKVVVFDSFWMIFCFFRDFGWFWQLLFGDLFEEFSWMLDDFGDILVIFDGSLKIWLLGLREHLQEDLYLMEKTYGSLKPPQWLKSVCCSLMILAEYCFFCWWIWWTLIQSLVDFCNCSWMQLDVDGSLYMPLFDGLNLPGLIVRKGNQTKSYIVSILQLRMLCFLRIANSGFTILTMQPDVFVENCCETTRFRRLWMGSGVSLMSLPAMWGPCLFGTSWDYIDYRGDVTTLVTRIFFENSYVMVSFISVLDTDLHNMTHPSETR